MNQWVSMSIRINRMIQKLNVGKMTKWRWGLRIYKIEFRISGIQTNRWICDRIRWIEIRILPVLGISLNWDELWIYENEFRISGIRTSQWICDESDNSTFEYWKRKWDEYDWWTNFHQMLPKSIKKIGFNMSVCVKKNKDGGETNCSSQTRFCIHFRYKHVTSNHNVLQLIG